MKSLVLRFVVLGTWAVSAVEAFSVENRRSFLTEAATTAFGAATIATASLTTPTVASAAYRLGDPNSVVGREIRSFNALVQEFQNTALDGGLDASKIEGLSMPFLEFGEYMKKGQVAEVEFMAPSGAEAYVTLKTKSGKVLPPPKPGTKPKSSENNGKYPAGIPIRIGQGYPTGGKNSWSSPDYVIRSVSNFGVPYKFTVPALKKSVASKKK